MRVVGLTRRCGEQRPPRRHTFTRSVAQMVLSAHRRVGRCSFLVILGTTVLAMSSALGAIACGAAVSSGSVLEAARTAIAEQFGVHVVFTAHSGSTGLTEKIIADVGGTGGTENPRRHGQRCDQSDADLRLRQRESLRLDQALRHDFGRCEGARNEVGSLESRRQPVCDPQIGPHDEVGLCPAPQRQGDKRVY